MTLFVVIYLLALCCYFYTRTSGKKLYRALNKYLMATMYLVLAIVVFFRKYTFASYQLLLMAALILASRVFTRLSYPPASAINGKYPDFTISLKFILLSFRFVIYRT